MGFFMAEKGVPQTKLKNCVKKKTIEGNKFVWVTKNDDGRRDIHSLNFFFLSQLSLERLKKIATRTRKLTEEKAKE